MSDPDHEWTVELHMKGSDKKRVAPPDDDEDGGRVHYYDENQARSKALDQSLRDDVEIVYLRRSPGTKLPERFKDGKNLGLYLEFSNPNQTDEGTRER